MITSFEVGSIFKIVDEATPTLIKISERVGALSKELTAVQTKMKELGNLKITGLSESLAKIEGKLGTVGEASTAAQEVITKNFLRADESIDKTIGAVGRLTTALREAKEETRGVGVLPPPRAIGGTGGGGGGHTPGTNSHSSKGGSWRHGVANVGYGGLDLAIGAGIGAELLSHGVFDLIKQGAELNRVQVQMKQGGFSNQDIAASLRESWKVGEKYGIDVSKVMGDIKELAQPFGSTEHAINFIEPLERMRVVLDAVKEGEGTTSRDAVYKMARAGELKGLVEAKDYVQYFDAMTKVISATGGKVGPNDFMQATKYARLSALGFNQEYYTKYLPTMIQALGASGAGTANAALFGTLIQGKATERSTKAMDSIGLIGDRSKITRDKHGNITGFTSGAIIDTDLLTQNPLEWVKKDLLPRMEKKFGDLSVAKNKSAAIDNLGDFFGNRMSAQAVGEMLFRMKSFDRDAARIDKATGLGGVEEIQNKDAFAAAEKLNGSFDNLLKALGGPLVDPAVKAMNALSAGLVKITDWAREHPEAVKQIGAALTGIAVGLAAITVAGIAVAAAALAPGGAIALAIGTVVGAIAGLAALNWDAVAKGLKSVFSTISDWIHEHIWQLPGSRDQNLGDNIGPLPQSYSGADPAGGRLWMTSFGGDTPANDNGGSKKIVQIAGGISGSINNASGGIINILSTGGGFGSGGLGGGGFGGGLGGGRVGRSGRGAGAYNDTSGAGSLGNFSKDEMARGMHAMDILTGKGWTPEAAASMVSQAMEESNINPMPKGYADGGTAHGMHQWRFERFAALKEFAARRGKPWSDFDTQVLFADHEARLRYHGNAWSQTHSLYQGGVYGKAYEGYGTNSFGDRLRNSQALLRHYRHHFAVAAPPKKSATIHIDHKTHLDGKVIAKVVTKHQVAELRNPHGIGGFDDHGMRIPAGGTMFAA